MLERVGILQRSCVGMARPVLLITMTTPREGAVPSSSPVDQWMKRLQEAHRLVDEVAERAKRVAERESVPPSLPRELQRRNAEIRHVPYTRLPYHRWPQGPR